MTAFKKGMALFTTDDEGCRDLYEIAAIAPDGQTATILHLWLDDLDIFGEETENAIIVNGTYLRIAHDDSATVLTAKQFNLNAQTPDWRNLKKAIRRAGRN